jgi:hypothetical protein
MRKTNLQRLLARRPDGIFISQFEQGEIAPDLFRKACEFGLEGVVSKHRELWGFGNRPSSTDPHVGRAIEATRSAPAVNLKTLFQRIERLRNRETAVLAWFWLSSWQSLCVVPFRGKRDDCSRVDEPEQHAGVVAADQPGPKRLGRAVARHLLRLYIADQRVEKRKYGMSTRKRKTIRKTAPMLGAAAAAGLFSAMGTAMAADRSAQPVSQIVLSDEAEVTFAGLNNGHYHSNPATTRRSWGKGAAAV